MLSPPQTPAYRVLVLKTDKLCAEMMRQAAQRVFPAAAIHVVARIDHAARVLELGPADLMLAGIELGDADALDFLMANIGSRLVRRTMLVTSRHDQRVLIALKSLPLDGVFDPSSEGVATLEHALRVVSAGKCYFSPSALQRLQQHCCDAMSICRLLTRTEQLVLAVIGDGCDDEAAARWLDLKPATVQSVRRAIHHKLGVQHRGELVRVAIQHGFVRLTPEGIRRAGLGTIHSACCACRTGGPHRGGVLRAVASSGNPAAVAEASIV